MAKRATQMRDHPMTDEERERIAKRKRNHRCSTRSRRAFFLDYSDECSSLLGDRTFRSASDRLRVPVRRIGISLLEAFEAGTKGKRKCDGRLAHYRSLNDGINLKSAKAARFPPCTTISSTRKMPRSAPCSHCAPFDLLCRLVLYGKAYWR
jgi:hypothetical protein